MASDDQNKDSKDFDVVLVHGKTPDGEGACVLRARPGRLEAGEVRPLREGRPVHGGGQILQLAPRPGSYLYDVKAQYDVPSVGAAQPEAAHAGPAQVATSAYRESWERTFGTPGPNRALN
jgi:hypothetical protein